MQEENFEQIIIDLYKEKEPLLQSSANEILEIKDNAILKFRQAQEDVKQRLISDERIKEDDLEKIYLDIMKEINEEIIKDAENKIGEIVEKYSKN